MAQIFPLVFLACSENDYLKEREWNIANKLVHLVNLLMSLKAVRLRHALFGGKRGGECERLTKHAERVFSATTDFSKTVVTFNYSLVDFPVMF